jgi:hypothetical protein
MDCVGKVRHGRKLGGGGVNLVKECGVHRGEKVRERKVKGTTKRMDRIEVT